jgi:predicted Zn-dependent protease
MNERIVQTLRTLRQYALDKGGCDVAIFYQEENSALMRFANSAISLNTNEHIIRLEIGASRARQRASCELITDLSKLEEMKQSIDQAMAMVELAMPLNYQPAEVILKESFIDESGLDPALDSVSNEEKLAFFTQAVDGLETDELKLSGIFSSGVNIVAQINTHSEHIQYFATSDAQVTIVLAHSGLKWEVTAEQSAQRKSDLDAPSLHRDLKFLLERYQNDPAMQIPVGTYDIIFGSAATADLLAIMNWIGISGGAMKRGFSFIAEDKVGQKILSERITLVDDPDCRETFPFQRDLTGIVRKPFPFFENGVFRGFAWSQDDADEFSAQPTGHTLMHKSLFLRGGDRNVNTLEELANMPRERDILYIPFLHYMNIVNPSKGVVTASSRFGALLLKKDGSVVVPFNVRVTQSLLDIFGDKVAWLSKATTAYNTSVSYGARNPTAIVVPTFLQVNDLEISHSNASY